MCGFAGFLAARPGTGGEATLTELTRMTNSISNRGPDDFGSWSDASGIRLAHRRLSILDLSSAGHQPMICPTQRYVIAFNGEIYNHLELRRELESTENQSWRGHSDTETLLAGFSVWGIKSTIERCIGMFAFAAWDRQTHILTLGRDRLGEKPLYYGWQGQGDDAVFLFGSELKALKVHSAFAAPISRDALALLMRYSYIPAPYSIYQGISKLKPGSLLEVSLENRAPDITQYWSLTDVAVRGHQTSLTGTPEQIVDELEILLKSAVRQQMMADVPLGAFLSGGIDSSTVVALMQSQSQRPVQTFTIGFNEGAYNEATHAEAVARHLGTDHTELYITPQQALDVIPRLPTLYCEPFADPSQIPTYLVSQLARRKVTVSLSGDAGDELFAGYNRYVMASNLWGKISRIPEGVRSLGARGIRAVPTSTWAKFLAPLQPIAPSWLTQASIGDKLHKGAGVLTARSVEQLYLGLVTHWDPAELVIGGQEPATSFSTGSFSLPELDEIQRMMVLDTVTYLPDDILVKVDRAAMGVSLEGRMPFLDHRVVEFAWRVPQSMKLREGVGKWILRQVLYRHVPKNLIDRPKMGFGVPIDSWLRGPLRDWAEELLDEARLRREAYFDPAPIRAKWSEHLTGKRNWQYPLWSVLMFQAWLEEQSV